VVWTPQTFRRNYIKLGSDCLDMSPVMKPSGLSEVKDYSAGLFDEEQTNWVNKYVTDFDAFQSAWVFAEVGLQFTHACKMIV
jgi:hypothetical protein